MKKTVSLLFVLCAALSMSAAETARYIVSTRQAPREVSLRALHDAADKQDREIRTFESVNAFAANLTEREVRELRLSPDVRSVQRVVPRYAASATPSAKPAAAPYQNEQVTSWGIGNIHANAVWPYSRGAGVNVAIIDTGIDATHPDLVARVAGGYNVITKTNNFYDDNRHGTHVSGIVAATDNRIGVVGVAPQATLWGVKALDHNGLGSDEEVAASIDWVIRQKRAIGGNWIISMSLSAPEPSDLERETVARAIDDNILVVSAAGNSGFAAVEYPAGYNDVVAVGAIGQNDTRAGYSSFGPLLIVTAPGDNIPSSLPVGTHTVAEVIAPDEVFPAMPLIGSPKGELTGDYVYCGLGREGEFPASVAGNIAVVRRGAIYFRDKGRNARAAGARGMVVISDSDGQSGEGWTLLPPYCDENKNCSPLPEDVEFDWPVTMSVSLTAGEKLLAKIARGSSHATLSYRNEDYATFSGTSMATPHVAATAALLWSLKPTATAEELRVVLRLTARDLGKQYWDMEYGFGAIDALAAAKYIAPAAFGLPTPPPARKDRHRIAPN